MRVFKRLRKPLEWLLSHCGLQARSMARAGCVHRLPSSTVFQILTVEVFLFLGVGVKLPPSGQLPLGVAGVVATPHPLGHNRAA